MAFVKMTTLYLAVCILAVLSLGSCQSSMPKVSLHVEENVVLPGKVVKFTCRLTGFEANSVVNFVKEVPFGLPVRALQESISTGAALTSLYREAKRFSIEHHLNGDELVYILTINGVQLEDSGWYSCGAFHTTHGEQNNRITFEVYRAPNAQLNLQEDVTINEGEVLNLTCTSTGALPLPKMEIWVTNSSRPRPEHNQGGGGMEINPLPEFPHDQYDRILGLIDRWRNFTQERWRNLENVFLFSEETKQHCTENIGTKVDCPLYFDYDVTATRSEFKPDFRHDEKEVTCLVSMTEMNRDSANASVYLNVLYKPRIFCNLLMGHNLLMGQSVVKINSTNHNVTCRVFANPPPPSNGGWKWTPAPCSQDVSAVPLTGDEYIIEEKLISANKKIRTLVFKWNKPVTSAYIGQRYCLSVKNDIGLTQLEVELKEYKEGGRLGAASLTSSWLVCLTTATLLVVSYGLKVFQ